MAGIFKENTQNATESWFCWKTPVLRPYHHHHRALSWQLHSPSSKAPCDGYSTTANEKRSLPPFFPQKKPTFRSSQSFHHRPAPAPSPGSDASIPAASSTPTADPSQPTAVRICSVGHPTCTTRRQRNNTASLKMCFKSIIVSRTKCSLF